MRVYTRVAAVLSAAFAFASCVFENDMSYPRLRGEITAFAVEGQKEVTINSDSLTVDVLLEETAEIDSLVLLEFAITEKTTADTTLPGVLDLSQPVEVMLSTYPGQDYLWTISASQPIERYVKCNGLIEAKFDTKNLTATVYVIEQPLEDMVITDMKLGPETSVITSTTGYDGSVHEVVTEPVQFPMDLDCTMSRKFTVLYKGVESVWTVSFIQRKIVNEIKSVNAWACHADVIGDFDGSGNPYYEYKKASDTDWTKFETVSVEGVRVTAEITGLEASTEYAVRLISADAVGEEFTFITESAAQVPNMNFDQWYSPDPTALKAVWYPYAENGAHVWDSANPGAAQFIGSSTVPEEKFVIEGKAARMESKDAVLAFAAGNIYTGKFGNVAGAGAELDWGYEFTTRPSALSGYYSYSPKPINKADQSMQDLLGQMDKCQIQVILADWDEQFRINTTKKHFVDIENDKHIIATGKLETDLSSPGEYKQFTIDLEYRVNDRKPKYVVISACASSLGDYFTGGVGSVLYIDEFEFIYR